MIEREDRGRVAVLRMAHGKANAVDVELAQSLGEVCRELRASPPAAVVLTGSGKIFSAGVDLFRVLEGGHDYLDRFLPALVDALRSLFTLPLPVVAALNGHAIAGGCVIACACDHRIMARGAGVVGVPELRVGVPFPTMALEIMRFVLPPQHFQTTIFVGATYGTEEALARGLLDELEDPERLNGRACEVAEGLASIPTASYAVSKQAMRLPVLERVDGSPPSVEAEILSAWKDPRTAEVIREHLARTIRRKR